MTSQPPSYRGYRFPPEIISHAVWLYLLATFLVHLSFATTMSAGYS
jgi:hypothetical protein